jgi:membrane fusion protein, heavy metal efflux system
MFSSVRATPILVVDDDEILGHVLSRVLKREGRSIVRAASAAQAMEQAKQQHPRLALLDLCLPDGDGIELARQLQAAYPDLALILMTAYPLRLREQPELAECFTRVLTKPVNLQELRQAVDEALAEGDLAGAAGSKGGTPAPPMPVSRTRPPASLPREAPAATIGSVTVVNAPTSVSTLPSRPNPIKWLAVVAAALVVLALLFLAPPLIGLPGVQALWTQPADKTRVEQKANLPVELVKGQENTLSVPAKVLESLGIRKGKAEHVSTAEKPSQGRPLVMPGSTAQDDTRLSRVRVRFNAQVIEIRKVVPNPELGKSDQNAPREIQTGDPIDKDETLAVLQSVEVANMKSTLVNAWVQLYFDQDLFDRYLGSVSIPEIAMLTAERNVRQDQTTIAGAFTTLLTWGLTKEDLQRLREEADELTQLRLKTKKVKEARKEEEAAWAVKKEAWARVEVKAPRSGTLVERNISLGEYVADNTQPLFQVADVRRMVVLSNPPEDDLPVLLKLKKEKKQLFWTVRAVGLPPDGVKAPISDISYFIDQNQHTAVIKGYIDNPEDKVRAGEFASTTIQLPPPAHTVEIPINALAEDGKQSIVFVVKKADKSHFVVAMRRVVVTHRFDKTAFVLSDFEELASEKKGLTEEEKGQGLLEPEALEEGARVLTSGVLELKAALEDKKEAAEGK